MAHIEKFKAHGMAGVLGHNERRPEARGYVRENIDPSLTHLNYSMTGVHDMNDAGAARFARETLKERGIKPRANAVGMFGVCISLPAGVRPEDEHKFYEAELKALCRFFPTCVLIQAIVHKDEPASKHGHMHVELMPLTADGRLCAKEVLARPKYRTMHPVLQAAADEALGYHVEVLLDDDNKKAAHYVSLPEYKRATRETEAAKAERDEAAEQRDAALAERDAAVKARDAAVKARDAVVRERDEAAERRDAARSELDDLTPRIATAKAELKDVEDKRDEASAKLAELEKSGRAEQARLDALNTQHAAAVARKRADDADERRRKAEVDARVEDYERRRRERADKIAADYEAGLKDKLRKARARYDAAVARVEAATSVFDSMRGQSVSFMAAFRASLHVLTAELDELLPGDMADRAYVHLTDEAVVDRLSDRALADLSGASYEGLRALETPIPGAPGTDAHSYGYDASDGLS